MSKAAQKENARKWYLRNREHARNTQRLWRSKNKPLLAARQKKWRQEHPEANRRYSAKAYKKNRDEILRRARERNRNNPERVRLIRIKKDYGVTADQWYALVKAQHGQCAICGSRDHLGIDHDHDTDRVRGLLCRTCNTGCGMFKDNPDLLKLAAEYLLKH